MSPFGCATCGGQPPLCDRCVDESEEQLSGVARIRGQLWAEGVRRRMPALRARQPWPAFDESPRVRQIALAKVADLSKDSRLRERMARWCVLEVSSTWTKK